MNDITVFTNQQFGELRAVSIEGEPWFVAADVCNALEIDRTQTRRLDEDEKGVCSIQTPGGQQEFVTVSEAGLYSLVLGSRKPEAKIFKRWVTHEVIPSIRKTGMYATPATIDNIIANPDLFIQLLQEYKAEQQKNNALTVQVAEQKKIIADMTPQSEYYKKVLRCKKAIPITIIAKDYGMSAKKMNKLLHDLGIQFKKDKDTWLLYQKYANSGYTKSKTYVNEHGAFIHTYWTQAGREFIFKKLKEYKILPLLDETGEDPTGDEDINTPDIFGDDEVVW